MKITFVDPVGMTKGLNAGLAYMSAALKSMGHEVDVVDINNREDDWKDRVLGIKSDVIGISLKSATVAISEPVINLILENKHAKYKICGGPHITVDGKAFMEKYRFDVGFAGETEESILDFIEYVEGKNTINGVGNIWYREGGQLHKTDPVKSRLQGLDSLNFPLYEVFDSFTGEIEDYPLVTSRGCPYKCVYCSVCQVSGRAWRSRSVDNVIEELARARKEYKSTKFHLIDDNFTLNMNRAKEFCRRLISEGLDFEWHCPNGVRADKLDEELLMLMKESGCTSLNMGIESGVPEVFAYLKKGEEISDIENAVRLAKKAGLEVNGFFIIGIPGSTFEDDMKSLRFSFDIGLDDALFNLLNIYPGTELWDDVHNDPRVRILRDWTDAFHFGRVESVIETDNYPAAEREKMFYVANLARRHYLVLVGETGSLVKRALLLLSIIWKYDRKYLLGHLLYIAKHLDKVA